MLKRSVLPTNDIAFKKLFTDSNNTDLLISFLNAMLGEFIDFEIKEISLQDPVQLPEKPTKKTTILDVYCKDSANNNFIVEMQVAGTSWSHERAQYYVNKAFVEQVDKSVDFRSARPVFLIAILCFTMFKEHERYITCHQTLDVVDKKQYLRGCNYVFVELPKFKKQDAQAVKNESEAWCMFFKNSQKEELMKNLCQKSAAIKKAVGTIETLNWTETEWRVYEEIEKIERDNRLADEYLEEKGRAEGLKKGKEEGRIEGLKEGMEKGIAKGKVEANIQTAKRLLSINLPLETIATATGLSIQELEKLKSQN